MPYFVAEIVIINMIMIKIKNNLRKTIDFFRKIAYNRKVRNVRKSKIKVVSLWKLQG